MPNVQPIHLPPFEQLVEQVRAAEREHGWLAACEEAGAYLVLSRELIDELVPLLQDLSRDDASADVPSHPILELCAGEGRLARALQNSGVHIIPTDRQPPPDSPVLREEARTALARLRPRIVLGSFVPIDASVHSLVFQSPDVAHYLLLSARLNGQSILPAELPPPWRLEPLPRLARWMITRHDAWLGPGRPLLRHGEAVLLSRQTL